MSRVPLATAAAVVSSFLSLTPAAAGEEAVSIDRNAFDRPEITVPAGTAVVWRNDERRTSHDVTFADGEASDRLMPGDSYRRTFAAPGRYTYVCETHKGIPTMHGVVIVEP